MPSYVYFKKQLMPLEQAGLGVRTNCVHYGTAVFEGIRGNWNDSRGQLYLFRLQEHYERLLGGCSILKSELPYDVAELCQITLDLVNKCDFKEDIYIRPVAYKSSEAIGVRLHNLESDFMVFAFPWGPYLDVNGVRCSISSWRRSGETPRAKISGLYVNNALAKTEAIENGFDEAIMLTPEGYVCEGSGENIFIVSDGRLITPGPDDVMLKGITRDVIIQLAHNELGLETVERRIDRSELYNASECFLTGTAANVTPVTEIDRRKIGDGAVGEVTNQLQKIYFDVIQGKESKYLEWCTPAYKR